MTGRTMMAVIANTNLPVFHLQTSKRTISLAHPAHYTAGSFSENLFKHLNKRFSFFCVRQVLPFCRKGLAFVSNINGAVMHMAAVLKIA